MNIKANKKNLLRLPFGYLKILDLQELYLIYFILQKLTILVV